MFTTHLTQRLKVGLKAMLKKWNMPDSAKVSLLNVSENATFQAYDLNTDRRLILRVHRPGYHRAVEIQSELAWILALREQDIVDTPAPVPTTSGGILTSIKEGNANWHVAAFEFMPGDEPNVGEHLVDWFKKLGVITAKLHQHAKQWQHPSWFTRKTWNTETMIGAKGFWGDWRQAINLQPAGQQIIANAVKVIENRLKVYGQGPERYGLVHADLRLANLLVDNERLGIIDFDDCGFCWFAYDFAAAISFHETDPSISALQIAWLEGYRQVANFSQDDVDELPTFIMLRRILLTAWLSTHFETPTGQELGPTYTDGTVSLAEKFSAQHG